jgi:hypothetical protein
MISADGQDAFELLLFATDAGIVKKAAKAGVNGFVVDLEVQGKKVRQENYDTQISANTIDDLRRVRANTDLPVSCRINGFGESTEHEVNQVIAAGADEIFLPMVRKPEEVERTLDLIRDRCRLAILIETLEAVYHARTLGEIPLSRVYIGLNDLAIDRGIKNIFESISDGTVESVRKYFRVPFGFGGLTLPDHGSPIPCRLLMGEMARLDCQFSFLRRSFYRDIVDMDLDVEIPRILQAVASAKRRPDREVQCDSEDFRKMVEG